MPRPLGSRMPSMWSGTRTPRSSSRSPTLASRSPTLASSRATSSAPRAPRRARTDAAIRAARASKASPMKHAAAAALHARIVRPPARRVSRTRVGRRCRNPRLRRPRMRAARHATCPRARIYVFRISSVAADRTRRADARSSSRVVPATDAAATQPSGDAVRVRGVAARCDLVAVGVAVAVAIDRRGAIRSRGHARERQRRRDDAHERPERGVRQRRSTATSWTKEPCERTNPCSRPAIAPRTIRSQSPAAALASKRAMRVDAEDESPAVSVTCWPTMGNMLLSNARANDVIAWRSSSPCVEMPSTRRTDSWRC